MSIVDDRMHVLGEQIRHERLWQTADPGPFASGSGLRASTNGTGPDTRQESDSIFTGLGAVAGPHRPRGLVGALG
jgi:hypothetical protein